AAGEQGFAQLGAGLVPDALRPGRGEHVELQGALAADEGELLDGARGSGLHPHLDAVHGRDQQAAEIQPRNVRHSLIGVVRPRTLRHWLVAVVVPVVLAERRGVGQGVRLLPPPTAHRVPGPATAPLGRRVLPGVAATSGEDHWITFRSKDPRPSSGRSAASAAWPPVEPCPPVPRTESGSCSTTWKCARSTRCTTS